MSPTNVLCPLDGSTQAERALPSAIDAAQLFGLPLVLFSVVDDAHLVSRLTDYLDALDLEMDAHVEVAVDAHPPRAIVERAAQDSLVTMATSTQPLIHHGYLGSAAETVVRRGDLPTLLIGPRATVRLRDVGRTVACCDGSPLSEVVLDYGPEWAIAVGTDLWVVTVVPSKFGSEASSAGSESNYVHRLARGLDAQWEVLHGSDPARSIAAWVPDSLILMTSHGRTGWSRLTMGSITTATVRWAPGPVAVFRGLRDEP